MFKKVAQNTVRNPIYVEHYYNHVLRINVIRGLLISFRMRKYQTCRSYGCVEDKKRGFRVCLNKKQLK